MTVLWGTAVIELVSDMPTPTPTLLVAGVAILQVCSMCYLISGFMLLISCMLIIVIQRFDLSIKLENGSHILHYVWICSGWVC